MNWQPIETAPVGRKMFVVCAFNAVVDRMSPHRRLYTSDPYCVWQDSRGMFSRWPHHFSPTHWMPLPEPPEAT